MSRDGKHNTILKLIKEPFVGGPIRFVHRRCKAEGRVLSGLEREALLASALSSAVGLA